MSKFVKHIVPYQTYPSTLTFFIETMKGLIIFSVFLLPYLTSACICNGITEATCTDPCFKCGLCNKKCCQNWFGREDIKETQDRFWCWSGRNLGEMDNATTLDPGK